MWPHAAIKSEWFSVSLSQDEKQTIILFTAIATFKVLKIAWVGGRVFAYSIFKAQCILQWKSKDFVD